MPTRPGSAGGHGDGCPSDDQRGLDRHDADEPGTGRPDAGRPSADRSNTGRPSAAPAGVDRPNADRPDADRPNPNRNGSGGPSESRARNGQGSGHPDGSAPAQVPLDSAKLAGRASAEAAVAGAEPDGALAAPADLTAAAFFDVDNTMMMGASLFHFARGMAARKFFTASDLAGFAWQQLKFRVGGRESAGDVQASREQALSFVAGRSVAELVELSEEIYDELLADRIWAGTRALAQMHLDAGQRVWLVTATPVELAQIIARRLGLTGALGTVAGHDEGLYTGRLVGEMLHGRAKAHAVRALAASEGLDLRRCTAYSDSANDVPMLSAVGTAVAVNPDQRLRDIARSRGWEIRDFRTGRKAARIGAQSMLGAGAVAGAIAAGLAYRRRDRS